eukprot:14181190-Alexandrium_andersonii.AAC.1
MDRRAYDAARKRFERACRRTTCPPQFAERFRAGGASARALFEAYLEGGEDWARVELRETLTNENTYTFRDLYGMRTRKELMAKHGDKETVDVIVAGCRARGAWRPCPEAPANEDLEEYWVRVGTEAADEQSTRSSSSLQADAA